MKILTKKEIINETINFYLSDPKRRSINNRLCEYVSSEGKNCAVGRCLTKRVKDKIVNWPNVNSNINSSGFEELISHILGNNFIMLNSYDNNCDKLLKPSYKGHSIIFWRELQSLHDSTLYWTEVGLTNAGNIYLKSILEKYR